MTISQGSWTQRRQLDDTVTSYGRDLNSGGCVGQAIMSHAFFSLTDRDSSTNQSTSTCDCYT